MEDNIQIFSRVEVWEKCWFDKCSRLQQENAQLKEENTNLKQMVNFGGITIVKCPECEKNINVNFCRETDRYIQKSKQLKNKLEKIEELINHEWFKRTQIGIQDKTFQKWELDKILNIIKED